MPLYIDEVDAAVTVAPDGGPGGADGAGLPPEQFQRLVAAVAEALEQRAQQSRALARDAALTGRNRPPSVGD